MHLLIVAADHFASEQKKRNAIQLTTKVRGSSDTFGVVGQASHLMTRGFWDRFPVEFTLGQKECQGGFLRVDRLGSASL